MVLWVLVFLRGGVVRLGFRGLAISGMGQWCRDEGGSSRFCCLDLVVSANT